MDLSGCHLTITPNTLLDSKFVNMKTIINFTLNNSNMNHQDTILLKYIIMTKVTEPLVFPKKVTDAILERLRLITAVSEYYY